MTLILLSWCYIIISSIIIGSFFDKIFKINSTNFVVTSFSGLFFITILSSIWAMFLRINIEFHSLFFIVNCLVFRVRKKEILAIFKKFYHDFRKLILPLKIYLLIIIFLIIAQCATSPFIIDNESYYIQTIKWLNKFGFVTGLANLHIFLGQTSGWHILQSVFNFSFLYDNFNDISGFCLFLGNVFAIFKLNSYFKNSDKNYQIIGLLPLANLFFFQFINAPSPDVAIYILTLLLFYYFIKFHKNLTVGNFNQLLILLLFLLYIKPISIVLILIPILLLIHNFDKIFPKIVPILILSFSVLIIYLIKNTILTGYPLYPFAKLNLHLDYQIPNNVISYMFKKSTRFSFFISEVELNHLSNFEIIKKWLFVSKINFVFNYLTVFIFAVSPLFIAKYYNKKSIWILYYISLLQLLLIVISVPQYRFFIHLTLFLIFIILASLIKKKGIIISVIYLSTVPIVLLLFFQTNFNSLTQNKLISINSIFTLSNIIFPNGNSRYETKYESVKIANLIYNSPLNNSFFWKSGNGNLPCVNKKQIDYFENYFKIIPQQRSENLKDGFYAKKIN